MTVFERINKFTNSSLRLNSTVVINLFGTTTPVLCRKSMITHTVYIFVILGIYNNLQYINIVYSIT